MDDAESPTTFNTVAGASITVAMIVKIGRAAAGNPIKEMINISEIVPPPTGTAVTSRVATRETPRTVQILGFILNKYTKNMILNTLPITDPSLWKLVPIGIVVFETSPDIPISFVALMFTGILAADEQVASAVPVGAKIFCQYSFNI